MQSATFCPFVCLVVFIFAKVADASVPVFTINQSYITKSENTSIGTQLFTFDVTDHDPSHTVTLTATPSELIAISPTSGQNTFTVNVTLKKKLNYESSTLITLTFWAKDDVNNEVPLSVNLYVVDVNDNPPTFENTPYLWDIHELPYSNITYTDIHASDADSGPRGDVTYSFMPITQSAESAIEYLATFKINAFNGIVSLMKQLDYVKNSYYQFTVFATDNGTPRLASNTSLIIRVQDVQNQPPFFTGIPYRHTIEEGSSSLVDVLTVVARDGDTGIPNSVNYTIQGGTCVSMFSINASTGKITTTRTLDRDDGVIMETNGACQLTIVAQEEDTHNQPQYGKTNETATVTITVEDVNDNTPKFGNKTVVATIQENSQSNVPIQLVTPNEIDISDIDQGDNARMHITLQWNNGSRCEDFKVSPDTVLQKSTLIIATEVANASHVATATVSLDITDENDNSPQFVTDKFAFNVPENPANGTSVGYITAKDVDSGKFSEITFTLLGSEDKFAIDAKTGEIKTICKPEFLDRETISIYYLTVTATDDEGVGRSNSTSVKITLLDTNDNAPEFLRDTYQRFVKENDDQYSKVPVLTVSAQDRDETNTNNSLIEYSLYPPPWMASNITINTTNGQIFFTNLVDFESLENQTTGLIKITVMAIDFGDPPLNGTTIVEISVEDLNDNSPIFNASSYRAAVQENATSEVGSLYDVITVFATDRDGSERNHRFQYFIQDGARNQFAINPNSGDIYVQRNVHLDRETDDLYNITVIAIDLGSDPGPLNGTTTVIINVTDVNDQRPLLNDTTCNIADIPEDKAVDSLVSVCDAIDPDLNHELHYKITDIQAENEYGETVNRTLVENYFKIDPDNGSVFVNNILDRETAQTIVLEITVKDRKAELYAPQIDKKTLTITLLDVNDNTPVFSQYNYTMDVSENALDPTRLDSVHATDVDVNRTITYSIIPGDIPTEAFKIDNKTGVLVKDGTIDRELNTTILLHILAKDNGVPSKNETTTVLINVVDHNDNTPIFFPNSTGKTIAIFENETIDTLVTIMSAYDLDDGTNADIRYDIESGDNDHFTIDAMNGSLYTAAELDREIIEVYTIRITATDQPKETSEERTNQTILTVKLLDVNDNPPEFNSSVYKTTVDEIAVFGTDVSRITATDKDAGENSRLTYSFLNNTEPEWLFAISSKTGWITVNETLKGLAGVYSLQVMAEDSGSPSLNGTTVVDITIRDVNLNPPVLVKIPGNDTIRVYECYKTGYIVYAFNYTDEDQGINAEAYFNITAVENDVLAKFEISPDGVLKIKDRLNADVTATYKFQIQVTDKGIPPLSSEKHTVTIRVIDVNNFLPGFTTDVAELSVGENLPNGTVVGSVTAVDKDADSVTCYNLSKTLDWSFFNVIEGTGAVTTTRQIDREFDGDSLEIVVIAWDCTASDDVCGNQTAPPAQTYRPNITVTIKINDVNDNPPMFTMKEISVGMRRDEDVGFVLDLDLKNGGYVKDNDTDMFGRRSWVFENNGTATISQGLDGLEPGTGVNECSAKEVKNLFCITGNGSIVNNKYFSEDMSGYLLLPVTVRDTAGYDQTVLKIYIISDSQVLIMTIFDTKESVAVYRDNLLELYSNITQHIFVYDGLQDHKTPTGYVDTSKSDIYFHVIDPVTQRALSSDEAQRLIDRFHDLLKWATEKYKVLQIVASQSSLLEEEADPMRTVYILTAVVVLLAVTIAVIIYASFTLRRRYQRKIKALSVDKVVIAKEESVNNAIPGSNQYSKMANPLLNAKIDEPPHYDTMSIRSDDSIDKNEVGDARQEDIYDGMEMKEKYIDMYMEQDDANDMENPLDVVLNLHEMKKSTGEYFTCGDDGEDDIGDVQDEHQKVMMHGFVNETFQMESTDI